MRDYIVNNDYYWSKSIESIIKSDDINSLIKLIIKYKIDSTDNTFDKIVLKLNGLFKSYLNKVEPYYRDDLNQELLIKIYKAVKMFKINNDLFTKDDLFKLDSNPYANNFNKTYGLEFTIKDLNEKELSYYINEINLFCNENQFLKYISKTFNNIYIDFLRKHKNEINNLIIKVDQTDFVDTKTMNLHSNVMLESNFNFDEDDLYFLKQFIENDRILTEKEVGERLGISQQAVNKRKKAIKEKYKNKNQ